jgi:hypothetical protein
VIDVPVTSAPAPAVARGRGRLRALWNGAVAAVGAVVGPALRALHHVGSVAGAALVPGPASSGSGDVPSDREPAVEPSRSDQQHDAPPSRPPPVTATTAVRWPTAPAEPPETDRPTVDVVSRAGQTAGASAARLLVLLAVALGLLAMHGLVSGHHTTAAAAGHAAALPVVDELPEAQEPAAAQRHGVGTAVAPTRPGSGPARPTCDDDCSTVVTSVCVAVLAVAAVTAGLVRAAAARRSPLYASLDRGHGARAPAPPRRLLPARDPVAELCVSRT